MATSKGGTEVPVLAPPNGNPATALYLLKQTKGQGAYALYLTDQIVYVI